MFKSFRLEVFNLLELSHESQNANEIVPVFFFWTRVTLISLPRPISLDTLEVEVAEAGVFVEVADVGVFADEVVSLDDGLGVEDFRDSSEDFFLVDQKR